MLEQVTGPVSDYLRGTADQLREAATYARPIYRITLRGQDITAGFITRLISLTLTDNRGMEADQLDIALSDHDGLLEIPPRGAVLGVAIGWSDTGLVDKGTFTVDEIEHSGAPDVLTIRARSADLREGLKAKKTRSWHGKLLGDILRSLAVEYGLEPVIDAVLGKRPLAHIDQASESDANLLTRLGEQNDAIASVKAGRLLFMPAGKSLSASGLALPHITLTRIEGDQHRYIEADRDAYTGVRARYYDTNSAAKKEAIAGGGDNLKDLRHVYTDEQSAVTAARAEWNRLQRGAATLTYTLARGRPDLFPELTYTLIGVKEPIDAVVWLRRPPVFSSTQL
jgi:phage protein D